MLPVLAVWIVVVKQDPDSYKGDSGKRDLLGYRGRDIRDAKGVATGGVAFRMDH